MSIFDIISTREVPATDSAIKRAENSSGAQVPSHLRKLLGVTSGGSLRAEIVLRLPDGSRSGYFDLIPVEELVQYRRSFDLEKSWPWARDGNGNALTTDEKNGVSFWDHDTREEMVLGCTLENFDRVVALEPETKAPKTESLAQAVIDQDAAAVSRFLALNPSRDELSHVLLLAARRRSQEVVGMLAEAGAYLESRDEAGLTPLICAASAGQTAVVDLLLQRGADPSAKTPRGFDALRTARIVRAEGVVRLLTLHRAGR